MNNSLAFLSILFILVIPALVVADYYDNQIGDESTIGRLGRSRQIIKRCRTCASNQCQVMGMQRFSEPRCDALGGIGAPCRMWQEPENKTLHFPHTIMYCNNVYTQFCPCATGLVCEEAECKVPAREPILSNQREDIYSEQDEDDDFMPISLEPNNKSLYPWAVARFH